MARNGGYKILDIGGYPLTDKAATTIPGLYARVESTNKALLLSGLSVDGVEYDDCYIQATLGESKYTFTAFGISFELTSADALTATKPET